MKIVRINRSLTKPGQIAFETNPPLTKEIFDKAMKGDGGLMSQHDVRFEGGCVVTKKTDLHKQAQYQIEDCLNRAVQELQRMEAVAKESLADFQKRMSQEHKLPLSE